MERVPRIGVALRDPLPWHELAAVAQLVEQLEYEAIFVPEVGGREAFSQLTALAGVTDRVTLATGVVPLGERSGEVIAMAGATLHELSGGRAIVGLGAGQPRQGALREMRETVAFLREVFDGAAAAPPGGTSAFELLLSPGPPRMPIWLAALGPKMIRLAGEIADGVILNWCTPERVAEAVQLVAEGAEAARRDPEEVTVAVYVRAVIDQEADVAAAALRQAALGYISQPAYVRQFQEMGLDPHSPEDVVAGACIAGEAVAARARLKAYRDAGADLPIVYPVSTLDRRSSIEGTLLSLAGQPQIGR